MSDDDTLTDIINSRREAVINSPSQLRIPLFERLEIETQSNCNRTCWFCPRTYDRSGAYIDGSGMVTLKQMATDKVIDLLDQASQLKFRGLVAFHFFSEPLLDKRNILLATAARERGMKPLLHTNGDALSKNHTLCEQVKQVYDFVVVGLYDYTNLEELTAAKVYWKNRLCGVDLKFSYIRPVDDRRLPSVGIPRALVPTVRRTSIPDLIYKNGPCNRPLLRMLIRYDGAFCLCCEDLHAEFGLGSVYESSLAELWYSDRHVRIIRDLLAGRRASYRLCARCPLAPTGPALGPEKIELSHRD